MTPNHSSDKIRKPSMWFAALFLSVLVAVGVISLISKSDGMSATENRALSPMPEFTVWSLFSGSYTDSLELYYADNFPLREELVQAAATIKDLSGYHSEIIFYQAAAVEPEVITATAPDTMATT